MSETLSRVLNTIATHQQSKADHRADEFGRPLCPCESCRKRLAAYDRAFIEAVFRGEDPDRMMDFAPGNEFAYDGDLGHGHQDYMRDNGAGASARGASSAWKQIGDALPEIASPSVVPGDGGEP